MYASLLAIHSVLRWLVLISLGYAVYRAYRGYRSGLAFAATDNLVRHTTATLAHIQLVVGIILYTQSPITRVFWSGFPDTLYQTDTAFFGLIHLSLMLTAIVVLTVGSALAKRKSTDQMKFKTMLGWFSLALLLILIAIPWPFSPWAPRPYLRAF